MDSNDALTVLAAFFILFANFIVLGVYILHAYFTKTSIFMSMKEKKRFIVHELTKNAMRMDHEDDVDYCRDGAGKVSNTSLSFTSKGTETHKDNNVIELENDNSKL